MLGSMFYIRRCFVLITLCIMPLWSCKTTDIATDIFQPSNPYDKLIGVWERSNDLAAGDQVLIRIVPNTNGINGILIQVSAYAQEFDFKINEVKWKDIVWEKDNIFSFKNLNAYLTQDIRSKKHLKLEKSYSDFTLTVVNDNELHLGTKDYQKNSRLGDQQTWVRIKE
jgi:hypothetical protein